MFHQTLTDHYELPGITMKAIENIGFTPQYVSAYNIYLNEQNIIFLLEHEIEGLIKNRKQSKEGIRELNSNPFHKDHFPYIRELDAFQCPNKQLLTYYKSYPDYNKLDKNPDAKIRHYTNPKACKICPLKKQCFSEKQSHRTITESGSILLRDMYLKMELEEYKKEYKKRSRVEGPFGAFRILYLFENEIVTGKERIEARMNLIALAYNLKRLYKLEKESKNQNNNLLEFDGEIKLDYQTKLLVEIY